MLNDALAYLASGLSVIPTDPKTKAPRISTWKEYQRVLPKAEDVEGWFKNGASLAVLAGPISGNLEFIDLEDYRSPGLTNRWGDLLKSWNCGYILDKVVLEKTQRGGYHVGYRHSGKPEGNQKLASRPATPEELLEKPDDKIKTIAETRGDGGYCLTSPSPGYTLQRGKWTELPILTAEERDVLLTAARTFDAMPPDVSKPQQGDTVWADYNARASIDEIIVPIGWTRGKRNGQEEMWCRPGKNIRDGYSATYNWNGLGLFRVFTSSSELEPRMYDKFGLFARLHHNGDFKAATIAASKAGYGRETKGYVDRRTGVTPEIITDDDGLLSGVTLDNKTFTPKEVSFLWEPRLRYGKCILWDADGGTGKTSLLAAIAAGFSIGQLPCGDGPCEPIRTAYFHKGEDDNDEIATIFKANGGDLSMITWFNSPEFNLHDEGLEALEKTIIKGEYKFVVFDALIYFCQHLQREGWKDPMAILPSLQGLARVADRTGCCISNVRHTTKGIVGKQASELGFGSVQFRNSHRGQMVMRHHPTEKNLIIVTDEKGNLLSPRGEAFAFRRKGAEIEFVSDFDNPFDAKDTFEARQATKAFAKDWLVKRLSQPTSAQIIYEDGEKDGLHKRTLQRALKEIGGTSYRQGFGGGSYMVWSLTPQREIQYNDDGTEDPYAD